jgi:hypothetical protein
MPTQTRKKLGSNVKAVGSTKGLTELGKLAMFTLPDEPKSGTDLVRAWGAHGLDLDFLPDKREGVHIFQSACRSVETRRHNGSTKRVEVKVDEVAHNAKECVYQITRLVRDEKNMVIEHPKAMTLAFEKASSDVSVRELEDYDALKGLEDAIRSHYKANAKTIPPKAIRGAVRELLHSLGAQNLRRKSGGVYFVPAEYLPPGGAGSRKKKATQPVLDGLTKALAELYGDRADFYTIPLVNDEGAREMVRKHFTLNVVAQSEELVQKVVQRVRAGKGRTVRADLVANLWNERRKIAGAIDEFTELVDVERDGLDKNLRDIDKAIADLQELAET